MISCCQYVVINRQGTLGLARGSHYTTIDGDYISRMYMSVPEGSTLSDVVVAHAMWP